MKRKYFRVFFTPLFIAILLITACAPAPAVLAPAIPTATKKRTAPTLFYYTPTVTPVPDVVLSVTFSPESCSLDSPAQVVEGTLGIRVVDKDPTKAHSVAVVTLDPGKTFADLDAYPSAIPPEWVNVLAYDYLNRLEDQLVTPIKKDTTYYLVCLNDPDKKVGTLGPITVETSQPQASLTTSTPGVEQWDLLVISDSSNWGVGRYYARLIEQDMHVKVVLHDCWVGSLTLKAILEKLQKGKTDTMFDPGCLDQSWADWVREAEVMVLFGGPQDSAPADGAWEVPENMDACVEGRFLEKSGDALAAYKQNMLQSCAPETWATYKADLGAILDEIAKIRAGKPLILRLTDHYIPVRSIWKSKNMDDVCTACMENLTTAIHEVADEYGVIVASTKDGLNGKDRTLDPREKGYIQQDGIHLSDAGAEVVAKVLQQSGYTDWSPIISSPEAREPIGPGNISRIVPLILSSEIFGYAQETVFSPDGNRLAVGVDDQVQIVDLPSGKRLNDQPIHVRPGDFISAMEISPNGKQLAIAVAGSQKIQLFNIETGNRMGEIGEESTGGSIFDMAFSPDEDYLAAVIGGAYWGHGENMGLRVWEVTTGNLLATKKDYDFSGFMAVAYSPDGKVLATGGADKVIFRNPETGEVYQTLNQEGSRVWDLAFSPDGNTLASASLDGVIRLWDVPKGKLIKEMKFGDPKGVITTILRPEPESTPETTRDSAGNVFSVAFNPAGDVLVSLDDLGRLRFWDPSTGMMFSEIQTGISDSSSSLSFNSDGTLIATVQRGEVFLWGVPAKGDSR